MPDPSSAGPGRSGRLQLDAVRRRAEGIRGVREVPTAAPEGGGSSEAGFVSFLTGLIDEYDDGDGDGPNSGPPPDAGRLARVTVFAGGTVCVSRVLRGRVRHVFRRNLSELDAVEKLLRDPPAPAAIDRSLLLTGTGTGGAPTVRSELELAEVGIAILQGERERLEGHRAQLVARRRAVEAEEAERARPPPGRGGGALELTQGMEFQFSLPVSSMKHVDQCLNDITKMNKLVRRVATNGRSTVFLYGNGGVAYTPLIPRPLCQRLSQLRDSRMEARPAYVALGSRDRFYCAFHDGSYSLKGPKELDRELKQCAEPPRSVAFANAWDSFFIVFGNGEWKYAGRSIPEGLKEKLHERQERADLVCVTLGPSGEWFLKAENGRMWWGGVHKDTEKAIDELLEDGHVLHMLDFGDDGSYFFSYD